MSFKQPRRNPPTRTDRRVSRRAKGKVDFSLAYAELYCEVFQLWKAEPFLSLRKVAEKAKTAASNVVKCLQSAKAQLCDPRAELYRTNRDSRRVEFTVEGERFFEQAQKLLKAARDLGVPADVEPESATIVVGVTNTILVNLLSTVLAASRPECGQRMTRVYREMDWREMIEAVAQGEIAFGIGPYVPEFQSHDASLEEFTLPIDVLGVCSFQHPFADEGKTTIKFEDLTSKRVVLLRRGIEPQLDDRLRIAGDKRTGGSRIEVDSYSAVVAIAMAESDAVGIVPGWYERLDELRKEGRLYYAKIEDASIRIAAYLPKTGITALSKVARRLFDVIRDGASIPTGRRPHVSHPCRPVDWDFRRSKGVLPEDVEGTWNAYHIECERAGFSSPRWMQGKVEFTQGKGPILGWEQDHDEEGVLRIYQLEGANLGRIFYWIGNLKWERNAGELRRPLQPDRYVSVVNTVTRDGILVGTWTGIANEQWTPFSGTMVLARKAIEKPVLQEIAKSTMVRFIQNADVLRGVHPVDWAKNRDHVVIPEESK